MNTITSGNFTAALDPQGRFAEITSKSGKVVIFRSHQRDYSLDAGQLAQLKKAGKNASGKVSIGNVFDTTRFIVDGSFIAAIRARLVGQSPDEKDATDRERQNAVCLEYISACEARLNASAGPLDQFIAGHDLQDDNR